MEDPTLEAIALPEATSDRALAAPEDFRQFRRVGVMAAVASAAVRLTVFFALAMSRHNTIVFRYFLDTIPYPVVLVERSQFAQLVSRSTLAASAVMLAVFIVAALRHTKRNQALMGWFMGVFGCGQMLLVDAIRHHLAPPVIVSSTALWTLWPLGLGCVVLAVCGRKTRPSAGASVSVGQERPQLSDLP
jgi:hypothetical protein